MKDTEQLNNELKEADDIEKFVNDNEEHFRDFTLESYLQYLLDTKQLNKADVIKDSRLDIGYAYHIFSGQKKRPAREKILSIALAMKLEVDEAQRLLYYAGAETLYVRNPWDSVVLFALDKHLTVDETNDLLNKLSEADNLG